MNDSDASEMTTNWDKFKKVVRSNNQVSDSENFTNP